MQRSYVGCTSALFVLQGSGFPRLATDCRFQEQTKQRMGQALAKTAVEYYHFYVAVFWFIVEMGWFSVGVLSFLAIFFSLCFLFLSWTVNIIIYLMVLGVYLYFRQNYYGMNKLPTYTEPTDLNEPW